MEAFKAGWKHILEGDGVTSLGHEQDFYNLYGNIGREGIKNKIFEAVDNNNWVYAWNKKVENPKKTYYFLQPINERKQLVVVVGDNGFVVSSYPIKITEVPWSQIIEDTR